jgi:IclR family transcriptional regulator, KDG regulon repressor
MSDDTDTGAGTRLSSVGAALRLLKCFSAEEPELGVTELARRLGVAKSTAHRLAATLLAEGFLEQNAADGRYRLGLALFGLGTLVRRRMSVSNEALPHLHALRDRSDETVHLAVLDGADIVYLFNLESQQAIRMRSYLGVRKPAFCTGEGRALLAHAPPAVLARVLRAPMPARTPAAGVTTREALAGVLAAVRRAGHAIDDEESEVGMRGVAAPVFDAGGAAVAAVGLAGPVQRLTRKRLREVVPMVVEAAQAISQRLGHVPA